MKIIAIDIETTGIDHNKDQILEFGAILEDTRNPLPFEKTPKFHKIFKYDRYEGGAYALAINQRIFEILGNIPNESSIECNPYIKKHNIDIINRFGRKFSYWLRENGFKYTDGKISINIAGKNFARFDEKFLEAKDHFYEWRESILVNRRILDPAILYWNPLEDEQLPNLDTCLKRAGITGKVEHSAIGDSWQIIQLFRKHFKYAKF